jgi:3-keto-5-aminohexanoate cleavage enzyme
VRSDQGRGAALRSRANRCRRRRREGALIPLIITATPNVSWLHPDVDYPRTPEAIAEAGRLCREQGAAILHVHAEDWIDTIRAVRAQTDLIVQCGMSSLPIKERMDVFREKADMISIILSHHDEAFAQVDTHALHPREELEEYARLSAAYGVTLEHEIWHTGSIWNLRYLIGKGLLTPPHVTTLFFDWPGGSWTPPTIQEYLTRRSYLPEGCIVTVSVMSERQIDILATAILQGDHIRVGTEDYPFNHAGQTAPTHELVAEAVQVARALGRPVASPAEARTIMGLQGG